MDGRKEGGTEGWGTERGKEFEILLVRALDKFNFISAACLGLSIQLGQDQGGWGQGCGSTPTFA